MPTFDMTSDVPSVGASSGRVTLVHGGTFCISESSGDVDPTLPEGLFFRDRRVLSALRVKLDGLPLQPLVAHATEPYAGVFVGRGRSVPGLPDSGLVVRRDRWVGDGLREDIRVTNYRDVPATGRVSLHLDADFAGLFDVKTGHVEQASGRLVLREDGDLEFCSLDGEAGVVLRLSGFAIEAGLEVCADLQLPAGGHWTGCLSAVPIVDGTEIPPMFRCGEPVEHSRPASSLRDWRRRVPTVTSEPPALERVVWRSQQDLGALRMTNPHHPEEVTVAAGAPWYMTLFGRDSLLTAWSALVVDPDLALGTLHALARLQGRKEVPETEEQPGRILHEVRHHGMTPGEGVSVYYGTVDATPLFVMLLGELQRWGLAADHVEALLPAADRALEWITSYGDADGDGFVEYARMTPDGLRNQGWKDSWDGVRAADGRLGEGPIALAEVQGYTYSAYLARAHFADAAGDPAGTAHWRRRAEDLRAAFNDRFWLPDRGWYAMGLDGDKRPLDALTSTVGHCLWTGIADVDKARTLAHRLLSHEVFTGFGLRTLASSMAGYNPVSYHNGSVWPHDTALVAAGLMRYGLIEEALAVVDGLLDAALTFDGRLPELFGGLDRRELEVPLTYPASCSPQAWAAATPLLLLRTMLRLDPWLSHGQLWLDPVLPASVQSLHVRGIPVGSARIDVQVDRSGVCDVTGLPGTVELVRAPRPPLRART